MAANTKKTDGKILSNEAFEDTKALVNKSKETNPFFPGFSQQSPRKDKLAKITVDHGDGSFDAIQVRKDENGATVALDSAIAIEWNDTEFIGRLYELNLSSGTAVDTVVRVRAQFVPGEGAVSVFEAAGAGEVGSGGNEGDCQIIYGVSKTTFDANSAGTNITFGDLTCYNVVLCPDPCHGFPTCTNTEPSIAISLFDPEYSGGNKRWIDTVWTEAQVQAGLKQCLCPDSWTDTGVQQEWQRNSATSTGSLKLGRFYTASPGNGFVSFEADGSGNVKSGGAGGSPTCGAFPGSPICDYGFPASTGQLPIPDEYFFSYTQGGIVYTWERGSDWGC